jgi:predicted Zn-ribbon and HTH transcriptional regulator
VNCPQCTSERIHQSRRKGIFEGILAMMLVRPFRCERCALRFFRWSFTSNPNSSRAATAY